MSNVNEQQNCDPPATHTEPEPEDGILDWARGWHYMVLCILIVAGFLYYPMWRFNKQWQLLQVGDSIDRMEALFGYLPEPSYSVQSNTAATDVYLYRKYWKSYEVTVSPASHTVLSKITSP